MFSRIKHKDKIAVLKTLRTMKEQGFSILNTGSN